MPIHRGKDSKGPFINGDIVKSIITGLVNKKSRERTKKLAIQQTKAIFASGYMG